MVVSPNQLVIAGFLPSTVVTLFCMFDLLFWVPQGFQGPPKHRRKMDRWTHLFWLRGVSTPGWSLALNVITRNVTQKVRKNKLLLFQGNPGTWQFTQISVRESFTLVLTRCFPTALLPGPTSLNKDARKKDSLRPHGRSHSINPPMIPFPQKVTSFSATTG